MMKRHRTTREEVPMAGVSRKADATKPSVALASALKVRPFPRALESSLLQRPFASSEGETSGYCSS
ncbi:hypothetical protein Mapa_010617 [Marchantia paleacea]|nr:hypothetical protein Mapa_010617 [Marchantia paleacea]